MRMRSSSSTRLGGPDITDDAVRQQDGFVQIVRNHHDGLAELAPDLHQFAMQVRLGVRVQRAEGLVQQQDARLHRQAHQSATRRRMPPDS